ncbi:MAG TPA: hypothetical protein DD640_04725 [Clostridiales bacterium]|nr:hypothetical protein [Clostridiales bacterium]
MPRFTYTGSALKEISFPIGGIGSGSIGLSGTGRLMDWEIFNRPNKQSLNGSTHFAIKAEEDGRVLDARVLNSDLLPSFMGDAGNFGHGPIRHTMAGVPHFRSAEFTGRYPRAEIRFQDETFPGEVSLAAWNPFIPLNDRDSSLPAAIFEITVINTGGQERDYVVAFSLSNPLCQKVRYNEYSRAGNLHLMQCLSTFSHTNEPDYGDLTCAVQADRASYQQNWYRGNWFDGLTVFWQDFTRSGDLQNRYYPPESLDISNPSESVATLAVRTTVAAGASATIRFVLAWSFPNAWNYWNPVKDEACGCAGESGGSGSSCCPGSDTPAQKPTWKNYYATLFRDSAATCRYIVSQLPRLDRETARFMEVLYRSGLPDAALEAVTANLSLLRSPTCLRLTDGSFYGFEGCNCQGGCCEGSCTHVWNYAYALPYLFPALERSMRELDFRYNSGPDGSMSFRLQLPLGRSRSTFRPCADGQFGGLIKVYREWRISGDTDWLRRIWPDAKRSLEYAWSPGNRDLWDPDQNGVLSGRQHHTLDMELFGPNSWLSGFYLAALEAGSRMAEALGEADCARQYRAILARGKDWVDRHLFNGEYFIQLVDLQDSGQLDRYQNDSLIGTGIRDAYWNEEVLELKYQAGEGSLIDQVLAQWHCDLVGLGDVFGRDKVRSALGAIFRYNYQPSFRKIFNPCRCFSLNDEAGTLICAWPEGKRKPAIRIPYSEETMPGFEYQAGCHMIMNGLEEEGLKLVQAVRNRFDGIARNPWNEFECGSNYARSMASYALLLAYSGFRCDMTRGHLGFSPLHPERSASFFWSVDAGWGEISFEPAEIKLVLCGGHLALRSLELPGLEQIHQVSLNGRHLPYRILAGEIHLANELTLVPEDVLTFHRSEAAI